jgi:hypothetical protein
MSMDGSLDEDEMYNATYGIRCTINTICCSFGALIHDLGQGASQMHKQISQRTKLAASSGTSVAEDRTQ